jgi:hypothetical protein
VPFATWLDLPGVITLADIAHSFIKTHTPPHHDKMQSKASGTKEIMLLMDPTHTYTNIRNNILKSGIKDKCARLLKLPSCNEVKWLMWVDAFQWDRSNPGQIYKDNKNEHLFLNQSEKMRNKCAEDVLSVDMLNLMSTYQQYLGEKGKLLDDAIELLQNTSVLIDIFRDRRPINVSNDIRLSKLDNRRSQRHTIAGVQRMS